MLPNLLTSSPLTWAGLIGLMVALPLLIHLINLLRHRRVQWAAMDFLLASYQKHRNWIWLKQLLLLLTRIAALLIVLLMLAQIGCDNERLTQWEGSRPTHHYLLIDDSYSMGQRAGSQQVFDRALATSQLLAAQISRQTQQRVTVLRFSQAQLALAASEAKAAVSNDWADLAGLPADSELGVILQERQAAWELSDLAVGPAAPLAVVTQWLQQAPNENAMVYLLSDFRERDWQGDGSLTRWGQQLADAKARLQLIPCTRRQTENLSIVDLAPVSGMQVAGVPFFMQLSVTNHGTRAARDVQVSLQQQEYPRRQVMSEQPGQWQTPAQELPAAYIEEIPAGETVTQQFPVAFQSEGEHVLTALLEADAMRTDNQRQCVLPCRPAIRALVIDEAVGEEAYYILSSFQPGRRETGFVGTQRTPAELERMDSNQLRTYDLIVLLDPPPFSAQTIQQLERFVAAGGGLTLFFGPRTDPDALNTRFYREGRGLLPFPWGRPLTLPPQIDESQADLVPTAHPVMQPFRDARNSLLNLVTLNRYLPPASGVRIPNDTEVLARVRQANGDPLVLLHSFGAGQVAVIATTASPTWHDWSANPTFVVMVLLLQEELVPTQHGQLHRQVGAAFERSFAVDAYQSTSRLVRPTQPPRLTELTGTTQNAESQTIELQDGQELQGTEAKMRFRVGSPSQAPWSAETQVAGVYEGWLAGNTADDRVVRWYAGVDSGEGELAIAPRERVLQRLAAVKPQWAFWDELTSGPQQDRSRPFSKWLLLIALGVLVCEQLFAYWTSYHPGRRTSS